ncbi:long-chain-fatty-acid--CoA ligase 1 [Trichomonascus vanleenenianus]|uniref:long-chain-fatty-acid--CoA ligase 1 n=1 Tax=Trichomonascus vanleenenianus TaxID=2268995 RepID=UPI003EC98749
MGLFRKKVHAVPIGEPEREGETPIYRNVGAKDALWTSPENIPEITTIYKLVQWAVKQYGNRNCMGSRTIVDVHEESKEVTKKVDGVDQKVTKSWKYFELSDYKYITFNELNTIISDLASGLVHIGIKPNNEERIHLYAQTSASWMQMSLAANSQGIPCVTAYDTLGEEGLTHSMVETETVAVFTDNDILDTLVNPLKKADKIRYIIYRDAMENPDENEAVKKLKEVHPDVKLYSFDDILKLGRENRVPASPPKPEDVALIMYTSGSTGTPKGVVLLNSTVVAGVAGVVGNINRKIIGSKDRILAFLPLAHILEYTVELATLFWGAQLGYGTVKTISDASVRHCKGDIREFKPTILVGVPAVWENVRKGINNKIKESSGTVQKVFWGAYHTKVKLTQYGIPTGLIDNLIFKKVRDATGGNLRFTFNGGAAISQETQTFITTLIAPMIIGYGLTETNANTCLLTPNSFEIGIQGEPTHAVELKLIDVPDAGYYAKNNQGEILVRGNAVSPYYFKNETETKNSFTEDGWFQTGDIGEWTPAGCIRIIDRKKNLVKTLNGEYIALEKLEAIYRSNQYVANVCIYADPNRVKPVAIIVPVEKAVHDLCNELGIDIHEDVAHDPKIIKKVHQSVLDTGKEGGLKGVELVAGVVMSKVEWTPQNGYLTSAQKLQRKKILADNKDDVEQVFENNT